MMMMMMMMMMMTRRVTLLRTVRDRSFVISTRETRETSTLDARSHEWMGGWVDRGAADDDDDDDE